MPKRHKLSREPKRAPAATRRKKAADAAAVRAGLRGLAWISFRSLRSAQNAG